MIPVSKMDAVVSVPFLDERQATIAFNSFRVEAEPSRSQVKRSLSVSGSSLVASFAAEDTRSLRVSVNSFFEHVVLIADTMEKFG